MKQSLGRKVAGDRGGFTLLEILVVVGIVMLLSALALPAIMNYFRTYQIRAATQQVASEIQTARNKAIARNVNFGVVFIVTSTTQYRWVNEDLTVPSGVFAAGLRPTINDLLTSADLASQRGPQRTLPSGITFGATCPGFAANDRGFRFNRLGGWCDPDPAYPRATLGACSDLQDGAPLAFAPLLDNGNAVPGTTTVCLVQADTGLARTVTVTTGGRVLAQP